MDNYFHSPSVFEKGDYALTVLSRTAAMEEAASAPGSLAYRRGGRRENVTIHTTSAVETSLLSNHNDINMNTMDQSNRRPNLLSDYNNTGLPSSSNLDSLNFNPSLQGQNVTPYMARSYQGLGNRSSQNYGSGDNLGILNAESYDDGRGALREKDAENMRTRIRNEKTMPFGLDHPLPRIGFENQGTGSEEDVSGKGRRKKRKDSSADEEEEARKKARGRPRVDTKDETAADRRRTQIRMAQRAYRHRKETTISSLEKQVQDLRGTNEEMSNIFINLYDFAISKGLLQREPEFGQQLQTTTERILAIAKATQDENAHDSGHEDGEKPVEIDTGRQAKGRKASPKKQQQEATPPVSESAQTWGGYTVSKDDSPIEDIDIDLGFHPEQDQSYRRNSPLQIITRPTTDNASFPFDFDLPDLQTDLQTYRVSLPDPPNSSFSPFTDSYFPPIQPPLPTTHNYYESSFARRIHRGAIERAFRLITTTDPTQFPHRDAVFRLSLLYETHASIEARLRRLLPSTRSQTLENWRAPFVNIGGSGTFYPLPPSLANDDSNDERPRFGKGYSMGPFDPKVSRVEELMDDDMHCSLPGFEGEFFDPNDVEGYLRTRGLDIAPAAEFVTGELDLTGLIDSSISSSPNLPTIGNIDGKNDSNTARSASTPSSISPLTPKSPLANLDFPRSDIDPKKMQNCLTFPIGFASWDGDNRTGAKEDSSSGFLDSMLDPFFSTEENNTTMFPGLDSGKMTFGANGSGSLGGKEKQRVTLSVTMLLDEILSRGVCLGRAPGFRPADVNAAIIATVKAGF